MPVGQVLQRKVWLEEGRRRLLPAPGAPTDDDIDDRLNTPEPTIYKTGHPLLRHTDLLKQLQI